MTDTDVQTVMSDKDAQVLLQQALIHLQRDQAMETEAALTAILKTRPADPDALQLMGVLRRAQGQLEESEQFYRKAIAANPNLPQVHFNLANLLRATGRLDEAIAEHREAIRLKPNYVEAHLNLAMVLADRDDLPEAEQSARRALQIQPNLLPVKQVLGAILNDRGKVNEAETLLRQALAAGSPNPRQIAALEHNLGVSMTLQNRYDEALKLFDSAQAKAPDMPHVDYNRANALQGAGQLKVAAEFYRRAIARNPLDIMAHRDLNHVLYRLGDDANFLSSYAQAMSFYPDQGALPLARANFLFARGDFEKAREDFERAAKLLPDVVTPHDGLGLVFARLGDFDSAIRAHETALKMEPQNGGVWRNYAETLLRAGDAQKGAEAAEKAVAIDPEEQGGLAMLSTALRMLDDPRSEELNNYTNLVQVFDLEAPAGYDDIELFNNELNAFLSTLHRDQREIVDQTLRGGTQTMENLFGRGHDLVERLRARIDDAVADYISRMPNNAVHPFLNRRRKGFAYSGSWSTCLLDSGYHTNHFHPKGWISSAYYVSVPKAVEDARDHQGWLKFGDPAFDIALKEPVQHKVKPRGGRLVLFPSYMWHGTIPFHSPQARVAVAFDAVPR